MSTRNVRPEAAVEGKVVKWACNRDIICLKLTPDGQRGWPDRMFILRGRVAFIEFKAAGEELRDLQKHRIDRLMEEGIAVTWGSDYDTLIAWLGKTLY